MQISNFSENVNRNELVSLSLGFFDGVHIAHQNIIEHSVKSDYKSVVVTFRQHPLELLGFKDVKLIDTFSERMEKLEKLGVDYCFLLDDVPSIMSVAADRFLEFLTDRFTIRSISCGFNYTFGDKATGNTHFLREFCKKQDIDFFCLEEIKTEDNVVSSGSIREMIKQGDVKKAAAFLFSPYAISGIVKKGFGRGRQMGLATANIEIPSKKIVPSFGVYKSTCFLDNKMYHSISNIGNNPTFNAEKVTFETHIIDFAGDIYGKMVKVEFQEKIRSEKKFSSVAELEEQIRKDIEYSMK